MSEVIPSVAKRAWARLIKQVYEADPLVCPRCAGLMRTIAFIEQPAVIEKILRPLVLWPAPAHSPPVQSLAAYSGSDPARATRAQSVGPDDAVRPGTGLRRSDVAPLIFT